jgi:hypothetical protein
MGNRLLILLIPENPTTHPLPNLLMKRHLTKALLLIAALAGPLHAQDTEQLLTTVGTTVTANGTTHAYLLWQPGDAASTLGKRFAIYAKPGNPADPGVFTRLGIQTLQTSPNTIRALLELGAKIDRAAPAANSRIDGIHREITLQPAADPATPADPSLDAADKLSFLIQSAVTDPRLLSRLFFLGRAHPGVMQALGHAFSIPIPAGTRTFEIREINLADNDIRVVGRVTLDPSAPVIPEAPFPPVQVFHPVSAGSQYEINAKDHLNARIRWGVDSNLRTQLPHTFGFDVFRVKKSVAESLGWHTTPPTPAAILTALNAYDPTDANPDIAMANELPILVGDLLSPADAANPADQERFDFSDDGVWHLGEDGRKIRRPYSDGEAFYYYVAARTITGAPGLLSPGSLIQLCDRLPPTPPSIFSVLSNFVRPANPADWATQGGSQFLQVKIRQLPNLTDAEAAKGYYIYRWSSSQEYLNNLGNPATNRIGTLNLHLNGSQFLTYNDNGVGSPTLASHGDRAVWYTVRAVGRSACGGEVISGHSSPISGVLRDFKAPNGPTGSFLICRTVPTTTFLERDEQKDPTDNGLPATFRGVTIQVTRNNPAIVSSEIEVALRQADQSWLTVHNEQITYQLGDTIQADLPYREPQLESRPMRIRVRSISANGLVSNTVERIAFNSKYPPYVVFRFAATATKDCVDIATANPPVHESSDLTGLVNIIQGSLVFPPAQGVGEWRIYRRVGSDGPLSLIAKAEGTTLPNPSIWEDNALPSANGETVCYYGQIFDQNANPSPLELLGCVMMVNPNLPTPMLAPAEIISEVGDTIKIKLEWFCDPVGVDRFEILAAVEGGTIPQINGLSEVLAEVPASGITGDFADLDFYPFQTSRIGAALGSGPGFGLEVTVPANQRIYFAVRACGPGAFPRTHGAASNVVSARWQPEVTGPQPIIPWPARPLPGTFDHRRQIESYAVGEGPLWPIILPTEYGVPTAILIGLTRHSLQANSIGKQAILDSPLPPNDYIFKIRETVGDSTKLTNLFPCILYRYQLPSDRFPNARANLVQCTPLIDRISWRYENDEKQPGYHISDPFLTFVASAQPTINVPFSGNWDNNTLPTLAPPSQAANRPLYLESNTGLILLNDPLPVTVGAKYRHLLVQFQGRGEIKRIIPLQPVQH